MSSTMTKPAPNDLLDAVRTTADVDSLVLAAEHAVIIADDLAAWALEAVGDSDSASRWRAVAETRRMANDRWSAATRKARDLA